MAIALGTAPATIGPGMRVTVTGVAGPVPSDDYLVAFLNRASDSAGFTYGVIRPPAAGFNLVTLGYDARLRRVVDGTSEGMAEGTAMEMLVNQYHANGTLVDSVGPTAYGNLDTHSYPWALLRYASSSGTASLDDILAAVQHTFPPTS